MTLSLTDYDFRQIVGKPDNVPIVAMLFIVAFFTWIYFSRAVDNDRRRCEQGRPLFEQEDNEKVLVWPDLVYTELICMVVLTAVLVFWGIALQAPLEEPASSMKTPNPSKAPWYFLGLQEMLVYFDPWLAGVVLAEHHSGRSDGGSVHRLQQAGERLLHVQAAVFCGHYVSVRVPAVVGRIDRSGNIPSRSELELLRNL